MGSAAFQEGLCRRCPGFVGSGVRSPEAARREQASQHLLKNPLWMLWGENTPAGPRGLYFSWWFLSPGCPRPGGDEPHPCPSIILPVFPGMRELDGPATSTATACPRGFGAAPWAHPKLSAPLSDTLTPPFPPSVAA